MPTLVQTYANAVVGGMLGQADALKGVDHKLLKGELRELFVSTLTESLLTSQFGIDSGIIVNQAGDQSRQTDLIIYDNRVLPPFVKNQHLGVYPAEAVLATIEVKSKLNKAELEAASEAADHLQSVVYHGARTLFSPNEYRPICAAIGLAGKGPNDCADVTTGALWLEQNLNALTYVCVARRYSWIRILKTGWTQELNSGKKNSFNETVRFLAVLLDNVRTLSQRRMAFMEHKDWLGLYLREQGLFGQQA